LTAGVTQPSLPVRNPTGNKELAQLKRRTKPGRCGEGGKLAVYIGTTLAAVAVAATPTPSTLNQQVTLTATVTYSGDARFATGNALPIVQVVQ